MAIGFLDGAPLHLYDKSTSKCLHSFWFTAILSKVASRPHPRLPFRAQKKFAQTGDSPPQQVLRVASLQMSDRDWDSVRRSEVSQNEAWLPVCCRLAIQDAQPICPCMSIVSEEFARGLSGSGTCEN